MKTRNWILLLALVFLLLAALAVLISSGPSQSRAEVYVDGVLYRQVDLSVDQAFTVETERGVNVITVRDGKIAVTEANCPDQVCVRRGFDSGGPDIVCLPNRLVIRFVGGGPDGVLG